MNNNHDQQLPATTDSKKEFDPVSAYETVKDGVVGTYKAIEDGVVGAYKSIEDGVVGAYKAVEDTMVDKLFRKDGETLEDAKDRLRGK